MDLEIGADPADTTEDTDEEEPEDAEWHAIEWQDTSGVAVNAAKMGAQEMEWSVRMEAATIA